MKIYFFATLFLITILVGCNSNKSACGCPYRSDNESQISLPDINKSLLSLAYTSCINTDNILPIRALDLPVWETYSNITTHPLSLDILSKAFGYEGVRYRRGGLTNKGLDCSGLVYKCFSSVGINLPRSSADMAVAVKDISRSDAKVGDLIFFKTNRSSKRINHVGLVTEVNDGEIKFIHASIQHGVIVSSTKEDYYARTYAKVGRVLDV